MPCVVLSAPIQQARAWAETLAPLTSRSDWGRNLPLDFLPLLWRTLRRRPVVGPRALGLIFSGC
jgi:hypothetical protein